MKTLVKKSSLLVMLFVGLANYAGEKKIAKIDRIKIEFSVVKKGQTITIKKFKEETVYRQIIKKDGSYRKLFDLSALENGNYTVELDKDFEVLIKSFKVEDDRVIFYDDDFKKIHKPYIRNKKELLLISKFNFDNAPLKITIFYENEIIFTETVKTKDLLKKAYRLSENQEGAYKVVVNCDNRIYVKEFDL